MMACALGAYSFPYRIRIDHVDLGGIVDERFGLSAKPFDGDRTEPEADGDRQRDLGLQRTLARVPAACRQIEHRRHMPLECGR